MSERHPRRYQHILSLDGGGTWALIQARALRDVFQSKYHRELSGHEVLAHFDLVVANSGGSLVAAALAEDMPLSAIARLFEDEAVRRSIFRAHLPESLGRCLPLPRYATEAKYRAFRKHLPNVGAIPLHELSRRMPHLPDFVVVGFDYDTRRATFFRTYPKSLASSHGNSSPSDATMFDAVHASSNAPVLYFDAPAEVGHQDGVRRYWDGALGGFNNPVVAGTIEALCNGADAREMRVLSIGTGTSRLPRRKPTSRGSDDLVLPIEPPALHRDFRKMAMAVLEDPPDSASFVAHVQLGGRVPRRDEVVTDGPLVRMNPSIQPRCLDGAWSWGDAFEVERWKQLLGLDMDVVSVDEVGMVIELCVAWLANSVANQPIRAGYELLAEVGHDTYTDARAAALRFLERRSR